MGSNQNTSAPDATAYPEPVFQAFTIKTTSGRARQKVDDAVTDVLGAGWQFKNYGGKSRNFEIFKEEGELTPPEAWELVYQLRAHRGVISAEPVFNAWVTDRVDWGINLGSEAIAPESDAAIFEGTLEWLCGQGTDSQKAKDREWSLDLTRVKEGYSAGRVEVQANCG